MIKRWGRGDLNPLKSVGMEFTFSELWTFPGAVVQIAAVDLKALEACDVDFGQVHRRLSFDDPFRNVAGTDGTPGRS